MATFETSGFNPRATNGSALDFMNPYTSQASGPSQNFYPQQQQQSTPFQQTHPFQQQFQTSPWQQQAFQQGSPWQQQPGGFFQGAWPSNVSQQTPYSGQGFMQQPSFSPFAQGIHPLQAGQIQGLSPFGITGQQVAPVMTTRVAELSVKIPVHRVIGKHPQEIIHYLTYAVLPVLLDGLIKRSLHPEVGISISSDLRGECVAEIKL